MQCGDDLAQGDAAVVGRDALVPIGAKARFPQALDGALGQITVLEAAARKDDAWLANLLRDGRYDLGKGVMEPRRDLGGGKAAFQVREDGCDHGGPVEER